MIVFYRPELSFADSLFFHVDKLETDIPLFEIPLRFLTVKIFFRSENLNIHSVFAPKDLVFW